MSGETEGVLLEALSEAKRHLHAALAKLAALRLERGETGAEASVRTSLTASSTALDAAVALARGACAGCAKVERHPGEGYDCAAHPRELGARLQRAVDAALPEGAALLGGSLHVRLPGVLDVLSMKIEIGDVEPGREVETTDALVGALDALFSAGDFEAARRLLADLDPEQLPPRVISGVLMVTKAAAASLGTERTAFSERAHRALRGKWGLDPEAADALLRRHA